MKKLNKDNGITIISLVITIVLMLILAGVTIKLAVTDGLFEYASNAVGDTQNAMEQEQELINDIMNNHIKPHTKKDNTGGATSGNDESGEPVEGNNGETFSAPYTKTAKDNYEDKEGNKATIPAGFSVGTSEGINKISTGLVIRDANGNEFVWIPVTEDLINPYNYSSGYSEPTVLTDTYSKGNAAYDSQATLDYLYGENYYNYAKDFNYAEEYEKMVDRVNYYDGFYIGRYETTIDENGNIGSKYNTRVLTADMTMSTNTNEEGEKVDYSYKWYGLYMAQKNANVTGNKAEVQTAMIYGQLWDKTMAYIRTQKEAGKTKYNVDSATGEWHTGSSIVNSGQANKTTVGVDGAIGDVALNIWDLEVNGIEWTQESVYSALRVLRGASGVIPCSASGRSHLNTISVSEDYASRLMIYIK